jgi:tetrapyrrole methylase family protein/MazG family protein
MPKGITIVGLGPGSPGLLTVEADRVLHAASEVYVRTRQHPTVEALPATTTVRSFDDVYERHDRCEDVYEEIATRVVRLGQRDTGVVYAVPGHPHVGEASVRRVLALAQGNNLAVHIVEGLSFVGPICSQLVLDPLDGLQIADAMELALLHYPPFNPDLPVLLGQLYSRDLASDVKLVLMTLYPDEHEVTLIRRAGTAQGTMSVITLYELDRVKGIDHLTSLYVPPLGAPGSVQAFQEVVARLRAPGGCPWDREQTHTSLRPFLLEETYEVLDALDRQDVGALKEELGDLLLQILLHTQIAIEHGEFRMADVISHVVTKLKRRHPHVFGQLQVSGSDEVLVNWEHIKHQEKGRKPDEGALAGVPLSLPALSRAASLQRRVALLGFDWPDAEGARAKAEEEWQELRQAATADEQQREMGDLLFALVSLARWLDVDAECALREAMERFEGRFAAMERQAEEQGQELGDLPPSQWLELWGQAKRESG